MKKYMLLPLICCWLLSISANPQNAPITSAPIMTADPGFIVVPITVTNFDDIGVLSLTLHYDGSILTYVGSFNNSGFPNLTVNSPEAGQVIAGGYTELGGTGFTLPDNSTLFSMFFNLTGGTTDLTWFDDGVSCEYANAWGEPLIDIPTSEYYINGAINPPVPVYAPIATLEDMESYDASTTVLISAENFVGIRACNLKLTYDPTVALATNVVHNPLMGGTLNSNTDVPGEITLGWFTNPMASIPGNPDLFTIEFTKVNPGRTAITFIDNGLSCAWSNINYDYLIDEPFDDYYTNGSLTFYEISEWTGDVSDDWFSLGNWSNRVPFEFVDGMIPDVIPNPFPVITGEAICHKLVIDSGSEITIHANGSLTATGSVDNHGQLVIKSLPTGDGSFMDNGILNGPGTYTVERYLEENMWHYVSPMVANAVSGMFYLIYLKEFSEETGVWSYIVPTNILLDPMKGYAAWAADWFTGSTTVYYEGDLNTGPISMDLTRHPNASHNHRGFNFVGNPYPCALDWNAVQGWTKDNLDNTIWLWNPTAGNYGTYPAQEPYGSNDVTNMIPAGQGFFVHVSDAYTSGNLGVDNPARCHNDKPFFKAQPKEDSQYMILKIIANHTGYSDEAILRFQEGANPDYNGTEDALKLHGLDEAPQLYTMSSDGKNLSINSLPNVEEGTVLPLFVETQMEDLYTIGLSEINGFDPGFEILLEDKKEQVLFDLASMENYTYFSNGFEDDQRFNLHFGSDKLTGYSVIESESIAIFSRKQSIIIQRIDNGSLSGKVSVSDLQGRTVFKERIPSGTESIVTLEKRGVYLVVYYDVPLQRYFSKKVFLH